MFQTMMAMILAQNNNGTTASQVLPVIDIGNAEQNGESKKKCNRNNAPAGETVDTTIAQQEQPSQMEMDVETTTEDKTQSQQNHDVREDINPSLIQ
jgi:hypothetical protein